MFGQNDDNASIQNANIPAENQADNQPIGTSLNGESVASASPIASSGSAPPANDSWQHPSAPLNNGPTDLNTDNVIASLGLPRDETQRVVPSLTNPDPVDLPVLPPITNDDIVTASDLADNDLTEIKHKALDELAPLVDQLNLPPEEKFRTIMMLIQASDDQSLVEKAYEAAHSIEDEKARAQALLDIVNEINYFTQPHAQG